MKTLIKFLATAALVVVTSTAMASDFLRPIINQDSSFNTNSNKNSNFNENKTTNNIKSESWNSNKNYNQDFSTRNSSAYSGSNSNNSMTINEAKQRDNTPSVASSDLTTSNGTCMGSTSIGGSGPGISATFGTTWKDGSCNLRYNAQIIHNMGYETEALAIMCQEPTVAKAAPLLCNFILDETQSETVVKQAVEVKPASSNGFF